MNASRVSLLTLVVAGFVLTLLGYSYAVARRAYDDWIDTKAKIKGLRKGFFSTLWALVKVGVVVAVGVIILVAWNIRDGR